MSKISVPSNLHWLSRVQIANPQFSAIMSALGKKKFSEGGYY
jgi:hypothetical protein